MRVCIASEANEDAEDMDEDMASTVLWAGRPYLSLDAAEAAIQAKVDARAKENGLATRALMWQTFVHNSPQADPALKARHLTQGRFGTRYMIREYEL